jgi:hypothetical protein
MVANPAPLMMSAKTYCSSLIEAFILVSPFPLSSHGSTDSRAPRCPIGINQLSEPRSYCGGPSLHSRERTAILE